jgi:hypothetical protein
MEEETHTIGTGRSSPLLLYAPPLPISLPHPPVWLPEELRRREGQLHRGTPSCCGNFRSDPNRSTSAISTRSEIQRSSLFIACVGVL